MELKTNIDSGDVKITRNPDGTETTIKEEKKEPDLVTRVSQFKKPEVKPTESDKTSDGTSDVKEPEFDFKEIENIQDPQAKAWAEKAYKSFQKGFNQKFQEIADIRKKLENQPTQPESWTSERLQREMNKPDFVQAAQLVIKNQNPQGSGLTDDEYFALTEGEKKKFQAMEQKLQLLERQTSLTQLRAEDEALKQKYANYDSKALDTLTADMISGKVQATREYLYKAMMHDENVHKAYEMGKQERKQDNQEKINAMSAEGGTVVGDDSIPKKEENETSKSYWNRLSLRRLMQKTEGGQVRK